MKLAIGTDHRGFAHKEYIKKHMSMHEWVDVGAYNEERTDYPVYAHKVIDLLISQHVDYGLLLCGTGTGMAIAANRYKNVYAGVVWNTTLSERSKAEDNLTVLVLPADFVSLEESIQIVTIWLNTLFKGGRYQERLLMLDQ